MTDAMQHRHAHIVTDEDLRDHMAGTHLADRRVIVTTPAEAVERMHAQIHAQTDVIIISDPTDFAALQDAVSMRMEELKNMIADGRLPQKARDGAAQAAQELLDAWQKFRGP